jgi:hypothetical protein
MIAFSDVGWRQAGTVLVEVSHIATAHRPQLKFWNESGTKEARIADSCHVRVRSPQHLAPRHENHYQIGFFAIVLISKSA